MIARPSRRGTTSGLPATISAIFCAFALTPLGCGVHDSDLIVAPASAAPLVVPQAVIEAIDARAIGGAGLTTGTTGGGTYAEAQEAGAIHLVSTLAELEARVSGDAPAIVLIAAGQYVGAGKPLTIRVCTQTCAATEPVAQATLDERACPAGATLSDMTLTSDSLRVGSNKTLIGLDEGARLIDVNLVLDGSSNVIVRNLSVEGVLGGVGSDNDGISLAPADHVWLDHISLRDIASTGLDIVSTWDQDNAQALLQEAGYVTISNAHFDGFVTGSCTQRSNEVLKTNRNPALTITQSWFEHSRIRSPSAFGPGTWMHLYNNLFQNIDGRALELSCGAQVIAQGNVFQSAHNALYNSDSGQPNWQFCAVGYEGSIYAPLSANANDANLLDSASTTRLTTDDAPGAGLTLPVAVGSADFELTVPVDRGAHTEKYRITLASEPSLVADDVTANAGVGKLF